MTCIYENSKYYAKSFADAAKIVDPIGYKYFNESDSKKIVFKKKQGQLVYKFVAQKTLMKQISSRGTSNRQISKFLTVSQAPRKNFYISGTNLDFVNKTLSPAIMNQLKSHFFSKEVDQQFLSFLELLGSINIIQQNLLLIRDYALSTYFVYYHGQNTQFYKYLDKTLKQQFLEYQSQILINSPKLSRPQLRRVQYENKKEVEKYIHEIHQIGKEKDFLYNGVHLYICDFLPELRSDFSIIMEESDLWQFLQFNIIVMMSILGDGQHGILRIRGTYTHKTSEYIFLLKLAFNRVYLVKNILSNPFTNDKYIICQFFNRENGRNIAQYLLQQYQLIFKKKAQMLLIDPKLMFTQDFQINITNFNDLSPIIKVSKEVLNQFMQNANMEFYPNKEILLKKLADLKIPNSQEIIAEMEKIIPNKQVKQKAKKDEIFEKQAVQFDFNLLDASLKSDTKKDKTKDYCDLSLKKDALDNAYLDKYMSRADKVMKDKKDKSKKKKPEKQEE